MDREQIFQWLQNKDFNSIIKFLKEGKEVVAEDSILQNAIGHFLHELISGSNQSSDNNDFIFSQLFILHSQKFFIFSSEQFETIIIHLAKSAKKSEEANFYASQLPDNPVCAEIITAYRDKQQIEVEHNQSATIKVHEVVSSTVNLTTSIFKSKQETLFFFALRNCFPTHYIYPNIALSTISKLSSVEDVLNAKEKGYFYNTTLDFVLIDQFNDFKPAFAIELDSEWHRLHNQNDRDEMKNKILKALGLKFYRMEHMKKFKTIEEFQEVILETTQNCR